jgi:hypothetical protein
VAEKLAGLMEEMVAVSRKQENFHGND